MKFDKYTQISGFFLAMLAAQANALPVVDPGIPEYQRVGGISGNLSSVGSDTLGSLMTLWAEEFRRVYPNVNIQFQSLGSSSASPALSEGTANLGPMSRKMKDSELEAFEKKFGYNPLAVPVAIDALAIFVNKDNPIRALTLPQVDAMMSSTRRCGHPSDIIRWGQVGLDGIWRGRPIQLYGRNSVSGTYGYFKAQVLCDGDFKNNVNELTGSASVVQAISVSLNSIGYSGIGYATSGVKSVALAIKPGMSYVEATPANAINGTYPLARYLYIYVNKHPTKPLASMELEFLKLVLSRRGQEMVIKDGYIPLPKEMIDKILSSLDSGYKN